MENSSEHVLDQLDDYVHEVLAPEKAAWVQRHCQDCPGCNSALEEAHKRLVGLQAVPPSEAPERLVQATLARIDAHEVTRRRLRKWVLGGAGGAIVAAAAIIAAVHIYYEQLSPTPYDLDVLGQRVLLPGAPASLRIH